MAIFRDLETLLAISTSLRRYLIRIIKHCIDISYTGYYILNKGTLYGTVDFKCSHRHGSKEVV
jgi:hypothetical protein